MIAETFTDPRCPVSRSWDVERVDGTDGLVAWHCRECGCQFDWPLCERPVQASTRAGIPLAAFERLLAAPPSGGATPYLLDVACGTGERLAQAAASGWKCFGVEPDDAMRALAIERFGDRVEFVADIDDLIPHPFDLIVACDVIEQVASPYPWMFRLFNAGAIGSGTRIVITTSGTALQPPSPHVPGTSLPQIRYTEHSLRTWLEALLFDEIVVSSSRSANGGGTADGLVCEASGSRFYAFMQERYVPGTWSKLAEYEHVPRYQFARQFAGGARVLDFGCGTGYGSSFLAEIAAEVVGLDIDADALEWAGFWHGGRHLRFERHADLGAGLPAASFDLVTCFEMIEHVDHATQQKTVESLARVVTLEGRVVISTPNPAVTANYGANPYHLREMSETEFVELLSPHFAHVVVHRQWMRPSILIGAVAIPSDGGLVSDRLSHHRIADEPPAFIAVCSHRPIAAIAPFCSFDSSFDMVLSETLTQKKLTGLRFQNYLLREERGEAERRARQATDEAVRREASDRLHADALAGQVRTIESMNAAFDEQARSIDALRGELDGSQAALKNQTATIAGMHADFAAQAASIESLRDEIVAKDQALTTQTATIAGMHADFAAQAASIESLRDEIVAKDQALTTQTATIAGMHADFAAQAASIDALRDDIVAKDQALTTQGATIAGMHADFAAQETNIAALRAAIAASDAVVQAREAEHVLLRSTLAERDQSLAAHAQEVDDLRVRCAARQASLADRDEELARQRERVAALNALVDERTAEKDTWHRHYVALEHTRFVRLARLLHGNSGSRSPVLEATYLVAGGMIPGTFKAKLAPVAASLRERFTARTAAEVATGTFAPYDVKPPARIRAGRPRVLHVIANFMTGGSSRLVVDLLERLGGDYEQHVVTSFIPTPANYRGVDITEIRDLDDRAAIRGVVERFDPHIVHVHYWGDCDEAWYRAVFSVAAEKRLPILQNVNTPVHPFTDVETARNVFVSRYVLEHFGDGKAHNTVIYPGSDFSLFAALRRPKRAQGCIGMVYRLERDKLDDAAVEPFIEAARAMPGLTCLIVGGGSLLQPFKDRVHDEGLDASFEFTGYVSYESLPALYRRMDVFVAPIWKESFGQVSAFAMNMGIPVVGYDVGAIPEIVADPSLVAPARDAKALAAIAVGLVRDDEARASIGVANRKRASRMFSVEAMIQSYRELYRDLLKQ